MDFCCEPLKDVSLPDSARFTYWYILEAFPRLGRAPKVEEMASDLFVSKDQIIHILNSLEAKGALRIEPTTHMILDIYPYSGVPTRHKVYLDKGKCLFCMCAVDTFYVPFLTGCDLTISSHCYHCRSEIEIRMEQQKIAVVKPSDSVVVWNSASSYDCPKTNFFCTRQHLLKWQEKNPDEEEQIYSLKDALNSGRRTAESMKKSREGLNQILWAKSDELVCYCREVSKATVVAAIIRGASSCCEIQKETMACTGEWCEDLNPRKRCCHNEIEALIKAYSKKKDDSGDSL